MEAITLTRDDYVEGLAKAGKAIKDDKTYIGQFMINFPDGLNTASALEICRTLQEATLENKIRLAKICIAEKNVEVTCPNGDIEKFHLTTADSSLEAFELFQKDPFALIALADAVYGHVLKKSLRLSKPEAAAAAI